MSALRSDQPWDMDAAWGAVQAELPEGWYFHSLRFIPPDSRWAVRRGPHWRADARRRLALGGKAGMTGIGDEALSALWRLADLLSGTRKATPSRPAEERKP